MVKRFCLIGISVVVLSGCTVARHAVPEKYMVEAQVFGMKDIRAFSGIPSDVFQNDFLHLLEQEERQGFLRYIPSERRTYSMLAISGGAANGAYGAGLLKGWSRAGTRPEFKIVTGISTGAIIAPFVFLGQDYDGALEEFYTKYSTRDIARLRFPIKDSIATTKPLEKLIVHYVDQGLLEKIAEEYGKGRRLYVGTTNLDAQRLVIWDMGKIASMGDEKALKLFRKVILASASVPVAFPPVYLDVEAHDEQYDEMHVDGGVSKQVFFLYDVLQGFDRALKEKGIDVSNNQYEIYVIRNGYVDPLYKEVPGKFVAIAERTVDAMTNSQSVGDLYQLYVFTRERKGDFNLAYIPAAYYSVSKELFDPVEMRRLFDLGYQDAVNGYSWQKTPPGL